MSIPSRPLGTERKGRGQCHLLALEPLEPRVLLDGGPITIQGDQFVRGSSPVFLNIIGYQPLEPGQSIGDEIRLSRVQEDLALLGTFQGGTDPVVLRVYAQPTPTLPVRMPKQFYDGMRDLDFWVIRDIYFDYDYWAPDALARGQAKVDAVLNEVAQTGGQDRILAWEIGNEFVASAQPLIDQLKAFLNAMVGYIKTRVAELWPGQGVSDYVTWASWLPCDPLRTDGQPIVVECLDFVSYNVYSYEPARMRDHQAGPGTGTPYAGYLAALKAWYAEHGLNVPLVVSESGYPDCPEPVPEHEQFHPWAPQYRKGGMESRAVAEGLADRYWDARLAGAAGFGVFEWNDEWWKAGTPGARDHAEEFFGIMEFVETAPGVYQARPKPQFNTIRALFSMAHTPGLIESVVPADASLGPEGRTTITVRFSAQAAGPLRLRWEASRGYFVNIIETTDEQATVEFYAGGRALGPATITAIVIDAEGRAEAASCTIAILPSGEPTIEALTLGTAAASGRVANVDLGQFKVACWIYTNDYWVQPFADMTSVWVRPDGYWWTPVHNNHHGDLYAQIVPKAYDPALGPLQGAPTAILTDAELNDADNDLLPDPVDPDPARANRWEDPDGDGADNGEECLRGTNPLVPDNDSDADGLLDNWELTYFGTLEHSAGDDPDRDGLPNLAEQARGLHPFRTLNNDAPSFQLPLPQDPSVVIIGQAFAFDFNAADTEPGPLTYSLVAGPPWLSMDAATGLLAGRPDRRAQIGESTVTVRVEDAEGWSDEHTFRLRVQGQVITLAAGLVSKTTFTDASGDLVSASFKGSGTVHLVRAVAPTAAGVYSNDTPGDLWSIEAEGTDAKSSLKLNAKAAFKALAQTTSVRNIVFVGSLKSFTAPQADLLGDVTVTGSVGKWQVRSALGGAWAFGGAVGSVAVRGDFTNSSLQALTLKSLAVAGRITEDNSDGDWDVIRVLTGGFSVRDSTWKGYVPPDRWFDEGFPLGVRAYVG